MTVTEFKPTFVFSSLMLIMLIPSFMTPLEAMPEANTAFKAQDNPSVLPFVKQTAQLNEHQAFTSYRVKLQRIKLFARQGHETLVLPVGLHINFVQYHNVKELLATLSVPMGQYERVVLSLDYSQAQAEIKGPYGYPQSVILMDDNHRQLKTLEVSINLMQEHEFNVLWGEPQLL
jgi:hypothetical protein